ncbi:formate--phosphoribosylaminoimidazolecarboxamide ligase family protein [Candidatus Woesearchaeota archaeon]|nr:formate--phosphoribosylaminoimidazolecarboxamide ligase family protein [Candidatus Woesearchaeota archaeon]
MISQKKLLPIISGYDKNKLAIGTLGGHSALDICRGAKDEGLRTVVVCQKGREKTYEKYYKSREGKGIVDEVILVDKFSDIAKPEVQQRLRELNTVFIQSRYFWVYCNYKEIENRFLVPLIGSRSMLKAEERTGKDSQYRLLEKAGIKMPRRFNDPRRIDRLVLVKATEAARGYERAFFFASSYDSYKEKIREMTGKKIITAASAKKAVIEEFIVGAQVNFNYFYSPLTQELELLGTDTRRQTNIDGLLRLTAAEQIEVMKHVKPQYVETGHVAVTVKESLLEKAFDIGERFVAAAKKLYPPGIIGPFALQAAITPGPPEEEIIVFDISARVPGSPGIAATPYSNYLYGRPVTTGRRIAMEVRQAIRQNRLIEIVT